MMAVAPGLCQSQADGDLLPSYLLRAMSPEHAPELP